MKIFISRLSNKVLLRKIEALRGSINSIPGNSMSRISEDLTVNVHQYFRALIAECKKRKKEGEI